MHSITNKRQNSIEKKLNQLFGTLLYFTGQNKKKSSDEQLIQVFLINLKRGPEP